LTREQVADLVASSDAAAAQFDDNAFRILAGERDWVTVAELQRYLAHTDESSHPLALNFAAVKGLFFVPAHGGRGRSLVELKDAVRASDGLFRALFVKHAVQDATERGMSVSEFRAFVAASSCGMDESVVDSSFWESTAYPEDEDDENEVSGIRADVGKFAAAVVRIANACELEATGESDKGLREQLFDWLAAWAGPLGIPDEAVAAARERAQCMRDGGTGAFFAPPADFASRTPLPRVYLDIAVGEGQAAERVVFELNAAAAPKAAYNFLCLCSGERGLGEVTGVQLCLRGSAFHRIVAGMCAQGGDLQGADGYGGESVYGGEFDDENFDLTHDAAGVLSMGNTGPNTQTSQFFITLAAAPHLDGENYVFGRVVEGMEVVMKLGAVEVDDDEKPLSPCAIVDCGVL
jgi:cyclophilin family peptidyl-prolyl cis-trans isomerase